MKKRKLFSLSGFACIVLFSILFTIGIGYLVGFRATLCGGGSSLPVIEPGSLIVEYKCSYDDLKVGDYITFYEGKQQTTHKIVAIAGKGDFESYGKSFKAGDTIEFVNRGVKFRRQISKPCTVVTMASNYTDYEKYTQKTLEDSNFVATDGSLIECVNESQFFGRVEHTLTKIGKIIIFIQNNFYQIIAYVIILWVGAIFMKFTLPYVKLF